MNQYTIVANIAIGTTSSGYEYLIDLEDLAKVSQYTWSNTDYLVAWDKVQSKNIYLHRLIMGVHQAAADHKTNIVHHVNHQKSDNRKKNLELVSTQKNLRDCKLSKSNTSCYTGVNWNCGKKRWQATVRVDGRLIMLGMRKAIEEAITLRKQGEIAYFK